MGSHNTQFISGQYFVFDPSCINVRYNFCQLCINPGIKKTSSAGKHRVFLFGRSFHILQPYSPDARGICRAGGKAAFYFLIIQSPDTWAKERRL